MRLSYSKLNTYRQCPLRYRFTYLDRLPRRPRRLFRASRRIHHALMRWLTYAGQGDPRWEDVVLAYDAAWGALQEPEVVQSRDYQEGLEILREFHAANLERRCRPVFLEHKFAVPVGPHLLIGAMDRVDGTETGYEVIDYKLDREIRTQEAVDSDLQLGLYQVALQEGHGIRPEALTLYFLRHNVQRTTVLSPDQTRDLTRWVIQTGNDISQDRQWKPCPGDQCGGCDFRSVCPAHNGTPPPLPAMKRVAQPSGQMPLLLGDDEPEETLAGNQLALPLLG